MRHRLLARLVAPLVLGTLRSACAAMADMTSSAPATVNNGVYVGPSGMTLYVFDRDTMGSGKSACNGQCAALWPPLTASASDQPSGEWTIVVRDDGSRQWAYKGKPVYYWVRDTKPGERSGDGFNNAWRLARP
jgi:predicted lipoprotein with Yx(FWY)xxD motif